MFNKQAFTGDYNQQQSFGRGFGGCRGDFRGKFGEAFGQWGNRAHWADKLRHKMAAHKAVNIEETPDAYVLSLYAAGLKKEQFSIAVDKDVLTISYQPAAETEKRQFVYEEYQPVSFERSFQLNSKVLTDSINATYIDGVLTVYLPKDPNAKQDLHEVKVS